LIFLKKNNFFNIEIVRILKTYDEQYPQVSEMLKRVVHCLTNLLKFAFGRKHTPSRNPRLQKVRQALPELTNADLEFLFTQLLEGVHQARGQQWAIKYLERMENRISEQRWIDWLLDFGERLLTSPAPNNQLAMRMVQLGELGIGTIGELAHDIGVSLLTRNLSEPYWENGQNTKSTISSSFLIPYDQGLIQDSFIQEQEYPKTVKPLGKEDRIMGEVIWEYDKLKIETINPAPAPLFEPLRGDQEQARLEQKPKVASKPTEPDASLTNLQPNVAVTLDELLVKLEQSSSLAQQLALGVGMQTTAQSQTHLERSQAWFYQGLQQAKTGQLSEAIISYDKAIEINPYSYEYWFNRGLTLFYLRNFVEAITSYDKAIEIKPNFYKGWYNRGGAQGELGKFEDAIVSFDKAIEIKFDYYQAWSSRAMALLKLGRQEEAISSYDQALLLQPQDQENWYYRGVALATADHSQDAIASYEKAIEINPEFHLAWYSRGLELSRLGQYEDAIASHQQAVDLNPEFQENWYALGSAQDKLGKYEEAVESYNYALQINPNFHEALIDRGVALANLGRWQDAILSWEKALEKRPDFYLTWFNQAVALENLGRREEAIVSYGKAIEINPEFHLAWYNRGLALFHLGKFEEAITSYDNAIQLQLNYWEAWIGRGTAAGNIAHHHSVHNFVSSPLAMTNPALNERGYEGKLASYQEGLKYVHKNTHPEGWARLHLLLGNAHYDQGKRCYSPHDYWYQAVTEYYQALEIFTPEAFLQLHLEVVQNLIKTLLSLNETAQAQEFHQKATGLLEALLSDPNRSNDSKKHLALQFAGFGQLAVDLAIQSGELAQALEIAERGKNACFTWLLFDWSDEIISPSYTSIQKLLNPTTAIIYWHISPCTLRTFILKYNSPEPIPVFTPVLNIEAIDEIPLPEAVGRLVEFEDWLEDWNQQYHEYRHLTHTTQKTNAHSWQADMEQRLFKLKRILNISGIIQELEDITQLILVPHRDLHRLPLHSLFRICCSEQEERINSEVYYQHEIWEGHTVESQFIITYLPNLQLGISLTSESLRHLSKQPLLNVEAPNSTSYPPLKFAKIEAETIGLMFDTVNRILGSKATKKQLELSLSNSYNIFHFNGHVTHNFLQPQTSELALADNDKFTLADIFKTSVANYKLITLSSCEDTAIEHQIINTEYVNLVSGLLYQKVPYVVSTLWIVESIASALVMIKFYQQIKQNKSAAVALSDATEWLKELTVIELQKWYEDLLDKLPQEGLRIRANIATELYKISRVRSDKKLYNHPYYWAAFKLSGRPS
jgi:tetratricopeptide (TPR) repeat protein